MGCTQLHALRVQVDNSYATSNPLRSRISCRPGAAIHKGAAKVGSRLIGVGHARLCQRLLSSKPVIRVSGDQHCMFVSRPLAHLNRRLRAQNRTVSRLVPV